MKTVPQRITPEAQKMAARMAAENMRSVAMEISVIVEDAYRAKYDVVGVDELPRPEGAEAVPLYYVQKRSPA